MNEQPPKSLTPRQIKRRYHTLTLYFPDEHFVDAVKAEAEVRNMSVCSFMRAMVRGYFGAALHGR